MSKPKVGFKNPPIETRFQPGQSGNPAGRKKGTKNLSTLIAAALAEKVVINKGGTRKTVSKLEAAFIQQANRAAGGDLKATKLMVDMLVGSELRENAKADGGPLTAEERRKHSTSVLAALSARFTSSGGKGEPDD